jgi:hypothetical protein
MEPRDERIEAQVMERFKLRVMPSVLDVVIYTDHVVGVVFAERDGAGIIVVR